MAHERDTAPGTREVENLLDMGGSRATLADCPLLIAGLPKLLQPLPGGPLEPVDVLLAVLRKVCDETQSRWVRAAREYLGWTEHTYKEVWEIAGSPPSEYKGRGKLLPDASEEAKQAHLDKLLASVTVRRQLAGRELQIDGYSDRNFRLHLRMDIAKALLEEVAALYRNPKAIAAIATGLDIALRTDASTSELRESALDVPISAGNEAANAVREEHGADVESRLMTTRSIARTAKARLLAPALGTFLCQLVDSIIESAGQLGSAYTRYNEELPLLRWALYLLAATIIGDILSYLLRAYFVLQSGVPSSGLLRDVFEFLAISSGRADDYWLLHGGFTAVVFAIIFVLRWPKNRYASGLSTHVGASARYVHLLNKRAKLQAWLIITTVIAIFSTFAALCEVAVFNDISVLRDLAGRFSHWERVHSENFAYSSSRCDQLRHEEGVHGLRQCEAKAGSLRLSVSRNQGNDTVVYPASGDAPTFSYVDLSGDFWAETRFRNIESERINCALVISEPDLGFRAYFHLVTRSDDRYPGYGAELVGYSQAASPPNKGRAQGKQVFAASPSTLPYLEYRRSYDELPVDDDQYNDGKGWNALTVVRISNVYELFVNRRPAGRFVAERATTARVALSVLSGMPSPGGFATCEFDYLIISAKP